jgi:uncharacterized protein with ParB-like and HNH nuclease domain
MQEENKIENIPEEQEDSYSNDDLYNINSWGADLSFRELITMYDENELQKPELQRKYVWDKVEASRFIDSILLGLPVPSIFLANTQKEDKLIIDGYQRIMTVYDYVTGIWSKNQKTFSLSNSPKITSRWRGKAFAELSSTEQKRIKSTTIHAIIFEQKAPDNDDTSLYQIFERINTGGRTLLPQEIRNCVYQGNLNTKLFELNIIPAWRTLFGAKEVDPRMRDIEYILRFIALNPDELWKIKSSAISLKKYLNEFMGKDSSNSEEAISSADTNFRTIIKFIYNNIGKNSFFNIQSTDHTKIRKRFHPTIFDSITIATSIALKKLNANINTENLEKKRHNLLLDPVYRKYTTEGTMQLEHLRGRISLALEELYGIQY